MGQYYSSKKIRSYNAIYNMIIGMRSNGKTYDWCQNLLEIYIKNGDRGAYIRRYDTEILPKNLKSLFDAHDIEKMTGGTWNSVDYRSRSFTLCLKIDGEIVARDSQPFCDTYALNTWEASKGADRGEVKEILFDEFMTRKIYLANEFVLFQQLLSSIIRDRDSAIITMVANTVNKYCPYFKEMGIVNVENMKQGDIDLYTYGDSGLTVAVEYCKESKNTKKVSKYYAFDNPQLKMITTGQWEIALYPHCPFSVTKDNIIFRFYVIFNKKTLAGDICTFPNERAIFILWHEHTNKNKEPNKDDIIFLEQYDGYATHFIKLNTANRVTQLISSLIMNKQEFYSTNEVGEIIRNWKVNQLHIGE